MILGNNETTQKIDSYLINNLNIPSIILMENAAISFVKNIDLNLKNYLIICGKGNNGGDGFAIARHLYSLGKIVNVYVVSNDNLSNDCKINYNICKNLNMNIITENIEELFNLLIKSDCIIDSIFGTGLNSEIKGKYKDVIEKINLFSGKKTIYSVDIPSGISGDTGDILGVAVKASKTISFITYKKAFLNSENSKYFGNIVIENIGINEKDIIHLIDEIYLDKKVIKNLKIPRNPLSHKGDFGKILIFAGNDGFSGAGAITTNSCIRSGAGLVTLMSFNKKINNNIFTEAMTLNINRLLLENEFKIIEKYILDSDVIAIGPGIGKSNESLEILKKILNYNKNAKGNTIKLVIDADGLNLLSENFELLEKLHGRAILTPHIVEFSRISNFSVEEINFNKWEIAKTFAKKYKIILLLKGKNTLITDGDKIYINSTGNSHMANGGMGDSLTGIISAFIGQHYSLIESANIGTYLHGYIADELLNDQYIINASHIIENISKYIKEIFK